MIEAPFALWLVPAQDIRAALEARIGELAERCGGPRFPAHATLLSGRAPDAAVRGAMDRLAAEIAPFAAAVEGLGSTDDFFTFFFVRLAMHPAFGRAGSAIAGAHGPRVGPHVSLAYAEPPSRCDRAALRAELAPALPPSVRFDALEWAAPGSGGWRDVARWEVRASAALAAAAR